MYLKSKSSRKKKAGRLPTFPKILLFPSIQEDPDDLGASGYPRNERSRLFVERLRDTTKRSKEDRSEVSGLQVLAGEDKRAYTRPHQSFALDRTIANPFVLGNHHPSALADFGEPDLVFGVRRKVIVVDLDVQPRFPERRRKPLPAEAPINEEDDVFMRPWGGPGAGNGLPPRFPPALGCSHPRAR